MINSSNELICNGLSLCSSTLSYLCYFFVFNNSEDHDKIEDQKKWLDNEVEKVLQQKRQMEELQEVSCSIQSNVLGLINFMFWYISQEHSINKLDRYPE